MGVHLGVDRPGVLRLAAAHTHRRTGHGTVFACHQGGSAAGPGYEMRVPGCWRAGLLPGSLWATWLPPP